MKYRIYLEPEDMDAPSPEIAWNKLCRILVDRSPILARIILIDENGFPIKLGGEANEK